MRGLTRRVAPALAAIVLVASAPASAQSSQPPTSSKSSQSAAPDVKVQRDVRFSSTDGTSLLLNVYSPAQAGSNRPAVVMLHGGEWVAGDKGFLDPEGRMFAQLGWVAFDVGYRVDSPQHWPEELHDAQGAVQWVSDHALELGVDRARIAMFGTSSGGHLAALVGTLGMAQDPGTLRTPDPSGPRVVGVVAYSPPVDLDDVRGPGNNVKEALPAQVVEKFLGCSKEDCPDRYKAASPINHVGSQSAPMFLVVSEDEVVPRDQVQQMADALTTNGVASKLTVLPGTVHAITIDNCGSPPCPRGYEAKVWGASVQWLGDQFHSPVSIDTPSSDASSAPSTAARSEHARSWRPALLIALVGVGAVMVFVVRRRRQKMTV